MHAVEIKSTALNAYEVRVRGESFCRIEDHGDGGWKTEFNSDNIGLNSSHTSFVNARRHALAQAEIELELQGEKQ